MNDKQEAKFQELTGRPVGHLVCKMAVPTIISMMVTACYNMVDTYFVGQLHSNSATGAVGVVFSLMAVIQAVGFFFGHGSGNYISRQLGRHETADAEKMAATGVTLLRRQLEELLGDTGTAENVRIDAVEQGQWLLVTLRAECLEEIGREVPLTKE